jgi:hypothetical protein
LTASSVKKENEKTQRKKKENKREENSLLVAVNEGRPPLTGHRKRHIQW